MWMLGLGSGGGGGGGSSGATNGGTGYANSGHIDVYGDAAAARRICSCSFVPGMPTGFRVCRCTTRCTPPILPHPSCGWLPTLFNSDRPVGFKFESLPPTTTLDITPQTEMTRDVAITFPMQSSNRLTMKPDQWRARFPPHRTATTVHPTYPIMPLIIELVDYTSNTALDLTIVSHNVQGTLVPWTPPGGTWLIDGDGPNACKATDGVYLPPKPSVGGFGTKVLYVYDADECARPSTRACLAIDFQQLQNDIQYASGADSATSLIQMPPHESGQPIRDAKQLFALCVAREITQLATTAANSELRTLVREQNPALGPHMMKLPHYFRTPTESRRPGVADDLTELVNAYRDKAGHARRCFDANSSLVISAVPRGASLMVQAPVTLHLRFTYVAVPHMTAMEPLALAGSGGGAAAAAAAQMKS